MTRTLQTAALAYLIVLCGTAAGDWPTYLHDAARSGVGEEPVLPPLKTAWVHRPVLRPRPAWPDPAKDNFWHRKHDLQPRVIYDRAFHAVAADGAVLFGSSADDSVTSLDAATGAVRWRFFTGGPVRLAPTVAGGRVYVGSDDGHVYCVSAADGRLLWKLRAAPDERRVIGNGRMISLFPVRTGVVVEGNVGYCFAGLFPASAGVHVCAFDALTGKLLWRKSVSVSAQGYMLAGGERLFVPSGRTAPVAFARKDGRSLGGVASAGGGYALVADDVIIAGAGDMTGRLDVSDAATRQKLVSFDGLHLVARDGRYYIHSRGQLGALDRVKYLEQARIRAGLRAKRKKVAKSASKAELKELDGQIAAASKAMEACWLWRAPCRQRYSLIMAGDVLLVGGEGEVAAYGVNDGRLVWSAGVDGRAYGLAAADGRLLVSTSTGSIHCFAHDKDAPATAPEPPAAVKPVPPEADPFAQPGLFPSDARMKACEATAETILKASGVRKGYCLVIGAGEGRLACEIARRTDLRVIGVEADAKKVAAGRERLARMGAYGKRVVLHQGSHATLPYPKYFANLVVCETPPTSRAEVLRVLRPDGGWAWFPGAKTASGWDVVRREALAGAGEWTHGLGDAGNTACSGDRMAAGPLALQWFGRPGPRQMIDRHHRNVPPLYKDGRLFVPGDEVYFCLDAYNGTILWQTAVPGSRRLGVFLDCSNLVVDEDRFYVAAGDTCTAFGVATGEVHRTLAMPQLITGQKREWGYLARTGDLLVGSGRKEKSTYTETSRAADNALWYDNMSLVTSDYLFALGRNGGERWTYRGGGVILNPTLTIGGGRMYFIESRAPKALANKLGRMPMGTFLPGPNHLVALDVKTGKPAWKREVDLADFRLIAYLSYADGKLLLSGNKYVDKKLWYFFAGLDAATGSEVWRRSHSSGYGVRGSHGEQNRHPTIVGDTVYAYPLAYHLQTGEPVGEWKFGRSGHGCGGISASMGAMFWRGANPQMRTLTPGSKAEKINQVTRPGCWINIIPAGGMVLIPEASSGCTCGYPMQTSLGYVPE